MQVAFKKVLLGHYTPKNEWKKPLKHDGDRRPFLFTLLCFFAIFRSLTDTNTFNQRNKIVQYTGFKLGSCYVLMKDTSVPQHKRLYPLGLLQAFQFFSTYV